jgi:putative ABC transport system permease protein
MTPGLYRALLRLLPRGFREEYGDEMCRVAEEHWRAVRGGTGWWGAKLFWARQSAALVREAARLHRREHTTTGGVTMDGFRQDLGQALRALIHRPGFSLITVATLGLGIGATTTIFSAISAVLLTPLPYGDSERIVTVVRKDLASGERDGVSAENVRDLAEAAERLSSVAVAEPWSVDMRLEGRAEVLRTWAVSHGFFDALGVEASVGRTFLPGEYQQGTGDVLVLSHASWVTRFGADPGVIGSSLLTDAGLVTVVGVMPADFRYPDAAGAWMARPPRPWDSEGRAASFMDAVGRLAPGASLEEAQAEADRIATSLREAYPEANADMGFELVPLREYLFGDVRTPLLLLMAAVGIVLLIACANVAGLVLARGAQRGREYALRGALGASTGRLISHVTAESLLLTAVGGAVGVGITLLGVRAIQALGPDHLPRIDGMRVDGAVLLFAVLAAGLSAILSGLAPSLRLSRPDLRDALGDGSRGATGGTKASRMRARLVVTEVAAAVVLLVGAGLLLRSFTVILDKELGFEPRDRLALQVFAYDGYVTDPSQGLTRGVFVDQVLERMEAIPGVTGTAITSNLPGATDGTVASIEIEVPFTVEGWALHPGQEPLVSVSQVTPRYFDVMGIDVVRGRAFQSGDNPDGAPVIMVNETFVRRHLGDVDPLGERLTVEFGGQPVPREIVGVVRDTRPLGHTSAPIPEAYFPLSQIPSGSLTFVLRAATDAATMVQPASEAIWAVNPGQAVWGAATLEALLSDWLSERRFNLFLLSTFSAVALALAAVGIYGLISFSVHRRLGELGIRRALGGQAGDLMGMVLAEGAKLAGTGVVIGLAGAYYLSRFLRGMLFEIEPTDPATFVTLAVVVLATAALATFIPAIRAMRVDPVAALRSE